MIENNNPENLVPDESRRDLMKPASVIDLNIGRTVVNELSKNSMRFKRFNAIEDEIEQLRSNQERIAEEVTSSEAFVESSRQQELNLLSLNLTGVNLFAIGDIVTAQFDTERQVVVNKRRSENDTLVTVGHVSDLANTFKLSRRNHRQVWRSLLDAGTQAKREYSDFQQGSTAVDDALAEMASNSEEMSISTEAFTRPFIPVAYVGIEGLNTSSSNAVYDEFDRLHSGVVFLKEVKLTRAVSRK